jgi:retinol dehydrogenase 12
MNHEISFQNMNLTSKTIIITGSTSGIGKATALELARQGATLVLPVRNIAKGNALKEEIMQKTGNPRVEIFQCDLSSFQSVRNFASAFLSKYNKLNILINNAGLWESKHKRSADGIELTWAVNYLAPFLLTHLLLDIMKESAPARIINVSSEAHRTGTINFNNMEGNKRWNSFRAYGQSKLANILFTRKLAELLIHDNITVNCLHPGVVATRLFNWLPGFVVKLASLFMLTPEKGAQTTIYLATSPGVEHITGEYFVRNKIKKTSKEGNDTYLADRLWEVSMKMTGLMVHAY